MTRNDAIKVVCDLASRYAENTEEAFAERITADMDDEKLKYLAGGDDNDFEMAKEVRDAWRAIPLLLAVAEQTDVTKNMHDLVEHYQGQDSYHDFEGLADVQPILRLCRNPITTKYIWDERQNNPDLIQSVLLAYLFERADTFGLEGLTHDIIIDIWECLEITLGSRWFSKVTDQQLQQKEENPC